VIEPMLEAERALAVGLLDQAERLYRQVVAADAHNSIAIVGLARVALERGDERTAYVEARRALALDPDNPMASHLVMRMGEVLRGRGEEVPPDGLPAERAQTASTAADEASTPKARGLAGRLLRRRR
jgi:predicted Zn-dependent protease